MVDLSSDYGYVSKCTPHPTPPPKKNSLSIDFLSWESCDAHENSTETGQFLAVLAIMFPSFHHEIAINLQQIPPLFSRKKNMGGVLAFGGLQGIDATPPDLDIDHGKQWY